MLINKAVYKGITNEVDVTEIVKSLKQDFVVNNNLFSDPEPNHRKYLCVNGTIIIKEWDTFLVDYFNKFPTTNRLGIFYTNNQIRPDILNKVLSELEKSTSKIDIITCAWEQLNNDKFYNLGSLNKNNSTHFTIVSQILQCLLLAKKYNKGYEYVSFLEHDVLYTPEHFDYKDFDENIICNMNYGGLNEFGYSNLKQSTIPLHQMTMKFDFAVEYFSAILLKYLQGEYNSVEPSFGIKIVHDKEQSIHIKHGRNFTNHYDSFSDSYNKEHTYWKNYRI